MGKGCYSEDLGCLRLDWKPELPRCSFCSQAHGCESEAEGAGLGHVAGTDTLGEHDALILPVQKYQGSFLWAEC